MIILENDTVDKSYAFNAFSASRIYINIALFVRYELIVIAQKEHNLLIELENLYLSLDIFYFVLFEPSIIIPKRHNVQICPEIRQKFRSLPKDYVIIKRADITEQKRTDTSILNHETVKPNSIAFQKT